MEFVSLHNHSDYSILSATSSVSDILNAAKNANQNAVAITDNNSLASAWIAYKEAKKIGIKYIVGLEISFTDDNSNKEDMLRSIILLAKNAVGYSNLLKINKEGFENGIVNAKKAIPVCDWKLLEKYNEGIILLTGGGTGILSHAISSYDSEKTESIALRLKDIFKENLGLEVQTSNMSRPNIYEHNAFNLNFLNRQIYNLGKKLNIPIVPTCNSHYINKEDHETHDIMLAIGSHQTKFSNFRKRYTSPDFYFKTGEEVYNFFARNYPEEDVKQFLQNTINFANSCEEPLWVDPKFSNPSGKELPNFPVKDEIDYDVFKSWLANQDDKIKSLDEDKSYLRYKCEIGIAKYFESKDFSDEKKKEYLERIAEELDVFEFHGICSYMLIVADYVNYAKKIGVPAGPGRGSVGGSLVAYLLGIHKADPIEYDLIFARFHNKEKVGLADIDSDFATSGRYKIEEYITNKYGKDNVAHVSNMNTLTPKVYSRDLARSCELGGSRESAVEIGTQIADSIPAEYHSISSAQQNCPLFVEYTKQYPEILDHKKIAGKQRAWSTHAAGIVIGNRSLKGLVPLRHDKDNAIALELTKEDAEEVGLVKMDLLGLSTLDILAETRQLILKNKNIVVPENVPFDDEKTYKLLSDGNTFGVFQLGTSGGTTELCKRIKPKSIADISIINSLARPAAKDIRSEFIATKDGKKPLNLMHEKLQRSFGKTYGFGLYEESLLYLAQDIAGWSLHSADRLRKLTKEKGKNPEKALKWRAEFISDSVNNGVEEDIATKIWDEIILPFGGYGFNMSHSIMYSMISYETAWLKANYPLEFLLANLMHESRSANPDASKNIDKFKQELRSLGVNILPPDINKSDQTYSIVNGTELLTGFEALESVGEDSILDILSKRPFKSFFDFMVRCGPTVRINAIQSLAASGALDCFGLPRKTIYLYVSDYKTKLKSWLLKHNPETETFTYPFPKEKDWTMQEKFALEIKYMGESFSCKTSEGYKDLFKHQHKTINDIKQMRNKYPCDPFHFILRDFFEFKIKKEGSKLFGRSMAKCLAEDKNGQTIGLTIFPDDWDALQEVVKRKVKEFEVGIGIKANCTVNVYEDEMGLILNNVYDILPIPQPPTKQDLAHKKVALRVTKKSKTLDLSSIEDELINEGLVLDQE